jgi:hypothetical protein
MCGTSMLEMMSVNERSQEPETATHLHTVSYPRMIRDLVGRRQPLCAKGVRVIPRFPRSSAPPCQTQEYVWINPLWNVLAQPTLLFWIRGARERLLLSTN